MCIRKYLPLLLVVAILGCGDGNPDTVKVTGTVTYKGKPVEGAKVSFGSNEGIPGAGGVTGADGSFMLTTFELDDGAVPGKFTVAISKTEMTGVVTEEEEIAAQQSGKKLPPPKVVEHLPVKYKDGSKSGLTAEVTEGGENDFTFDLKD